MKEYYYLQKLMGREEAQNAVKLRLGRKLKLKRKLKRSKEVIKDSWNLDTSFYHWFYERLMAFNEYNIIDTSWQTFEVDGVELTLQECIDQMIEGCELFLTDNYNEWNLDDENTFKVQKVLRIWAECAPAMWW